MKYHPVTCASLACRARFRVPESAVGKRVRCPQCKQELRVPGTFAELAAVGAPARFRIRIQSGPAFVDTECILDPDRSYTFGKADTCDQQLPGPTVSRRHISLHWVNNRWVLEDLNSTNGTQVNGLPVTKEALTGGENIQVGAYELKFISPGKALTSPPTGSEPIVVPEKEANPLHVAQAEAAAESDVPREERLLREAGEFFEYQPEYLEAAGKSSSRRYALSLATRLLVVVALLALATWGSLFAKQHYFASMDTTAGSGQTDPIEIPSEFVRVLGEKDFEAARTQLAWARESGEEEHSPELLERMKELLDRKLSGHLRDLLGRARTALRQGDREAVDRLSALAKQAAPAPLPMEWKGVEARRQQLDLFVQIEEEVANKRWRQVQESLATARRLHPENPKLHALERQVQTRMGAGLLIRFSQSIDGLEAHLGERLVQVTAEEQWELPPGAVTLHVQAPGHFPSEFQVNLEAGELTTVEVDLRPLAPPAAWALLLLEHSNSQPAYWLAARYYGEAGAIEAELARIVIARTQDEVHRSFKRGGLRICRIKFKDAPDLLARIASEGLEMLSVTSLPDGKLRSVRVADTVSIEDVTPETAIELTLKWIEIQRRDGKDAIVALESVVGLMIGLSEHEAGVTRATDALVTACLAWLENGCYVCIGSGRVECEFCAGKGRRVDEFPCPICGATGTVTCVKCGGDARVNCGSCNGTGKKRRRQKPGETGVPTFRTCNACNGTGNKPCIKCRAGQVTCKKCKGKLKVRKTVSCPECNKGRVSCPACGGAGSKQAMDPETRAQAEIAAAEFMSRSQ
ncbi:MAG: FHA domain-containing protein [Planctomycetes bacterium]|nr:FHA domain-containing protein [Planctomycetota bacterium]